MGHFCPSSCHLFKILLLLSMKVQLPFQMKHLRLRVQPVTISFRPRKVICFSLMLHLAFIGIDLVDWW
ncbi:hypothetical protein MLD38_035090 [Melastoma candidum]|uniref:Uncharacterized protein n=1 Tax=Melastoma candidum TaxID=119954 RepID=A0ACB9MCQ1_9MYRT|nr:hypothetical protein MLD38_035090 [Melastoma candidum]